MSKLDGKSLARFMARTPAGVQGLVDGWDDVKVDREDLDTEMTEQPALYAFYGQVYAAALADVRTGKYEIHKLREDLDRRIREKGEKLSEAALKNRINRSPRMREAFEKYMAACERRDNAEALREAFRQRGEQLRSIGANRRKEFDNNDFETKKQKAQQKRYSRREEE